MENIDFDSNNTSDDDFNFEPKTTDSNKVFASNMALIDLLPSYVVDSCNLNQSKEEILFEAIMNLHMVNRTEELSEFFKELGADLRIWTNKLTVG